MKRTTVVAALLLGLLGAYAEAGSSLPKPQKYIRGTIPPPQLHPYVGRPTKLTASTWGTRPETLRILPPHFHAYVSGLR